MSLCQCQTAEGHYFFALKLKNGGLLYAKNKISVSSIYSNNSLDYGLFYDAVQQRYCIVIGLCAYFISAPLAKRLAFKVININDRQIFIILTIQVFTVICQVAFASIIGVYHSNGFNSQIIPNYIRAYCLNFAMAMPLQIFVAGPAARFIFRKIYTKNR